MALGADKAAAKAVVAAAGVAVPAGQLLRRGDEVRVVPPAVVKPVDADNSVGVALVRDRDEFPDALAEAFAHADRVLVEPYIELGREVRCGAVERDGRLVCLPLEEYAVDSTRKPIRPYHDKISRGADGGLNLVAKDADPRLDRRPVRPGHTGRLGGRRDLPPGTGLPALQPLRLPHRPRRPALVPRGRPVQLVRPHERDPGDGRGGRHSARRALRRPARRGHGSALSRAVRPVRR